MTLLIWLWNGKGLLRQISLKMMFFNDICHEIEWNFEWLLLSKMHFERAFTVQNNLQNFE